MKRPEYVATVVRIYRKYLDIALGRAGSGDTSKLDIDEKDRRDLLQVFNRGGFSPGYLKGMKGSGMMSYDKPNNSGVCIGSVQSYDSARRTVKIKLEEALSVGDGIEIWTGGPDSPGGTVTMIKRPAGAQGMQRRAMSSKSAFSAGTIAWKESVQDHQYRASERSAKSWSGGNTRRVPVKVPLSSKKAGRRCLRWRTTSVTGSRLRGRSRQRQP